MKEVSRQPNSQERQPDELKLTVKKADHPFAYAVIEAIAASRSTMIMEPQAVCAFPLTVIRDTSGRYRFPVSNQEERVPPFEPKQLQSDQMNLTGYSDVSTFTAAINNALDKSVWSDQGDEQRTELVIMGTEARSHGPHLFYTQAEWDAFVAGAKDGEFDL